MFSAKGWNGLVLCALATAYMSSAIVALCLAYEFQKPLNAHAKSVLQWKNCGEANNHTLQCKYAPVSWPILIRVDATRRFPTGSAHGSFQPIVRQDFLDTDYENASQKCICYWR